jgi:hypothetical protein
MKRIWFWWRASTEIHKLTREYALEERIIAEAATRLSPGASNIAWLFRRRPAQSAAQPTQGNPSRRTSN